MEEYPESFKEDKNHAQLFIKISDDLILEKEAEKIIENLGIHIITKNRLPENWLCLKLDIEDVREAVLKLSEKGYIAKGINAIPYK